MTDTRQNKSITRSGVGGLDDVLGGGYHRDRLFLVEGSPGTGKTTMSLQFLMEGAENGERGLYITLSETESELRSVVESHNWSLDGAIKIFEIVPPESLLDADQRQSLLYSSDLELGETTKMICGAVQEFAPRRVILDSLSEIRLLAQSSLRYRRQILALKHYLAAQNTTVLLLDDLTTEYGDHPVHSVAHGVIRLEELSPNYGAERRRLRVTKYRGQSYRGGYHDFAIKTGGVQVYPRLVSAEYRGPLQRRQLSSGIDKLDDLLGGGVDSGTNTLILGPAGGGKSILAIQFAVAAIERGEKAAFFVFDEELGLFFDRSRGLGFDLEAMSKSGDLLVTQLDASELSPGEFSHMVRDRTDNAGATTIVIDSLNGFQTAMPEENSLILHMHELLQYLTRKGAATFLTVAQHGLIDNMKAPVDVTYLADTVILIRYFEAMGCVKRAISVIKKRSGRHENSIRELSIDAGGLSVGEPLADFRGVLKGVPDYAGGGDAFLSQGSE